MVNKLLESSSKMADTGSVLALRRLNWWKSNGWVAILHCAVKYEESRFHPTSFLVYLVLVFNLVDWLVGWLVGYLTLLYFILFCFFLFVLSDLIHLVVVGTKPWHALVTGNAKVCLGFCSIHLCVEPWSPCLWKGQQVGCHRKCSWLI